MKKIKYIKPLGQRDPKWANMKLGNFYASEQSTIGRYGCLLTCVTMLGNYYSGIDWTPPQVNYLLAHRGGFYGENLLVYSVVSEIFPEMQWDGFIECEKIPAPVGEIDKLLPVILKVDFNIQTTPVDGHYVLAVGKLGSDYIINDPWTGKREFLLARYGKESWDLARAIYRVVKYSGNQRNP